MPYTLEKKNILFGLVLTALIITLVYANTFDVSWHLDDYDNITKNPRITISDLYPDTLANNFIASFDGGKYEGREIYRPVAMFTFAMNWYFHQDSLFGYHLVNLIIHITAAVFLFFSINLLLLTPRMSVEDKTLRYQTALLAAIVWAIHPIQTMAVTYIVQRMASMAGMFYIIGLFTYLKFRFASRIRSKLFFLLGYILAFCLAVGAKQNAILLPGATLLVELFFFQKITAKKIFRPKVLLSFLILGLFFGMVAFVYTGGDINELFQNYSQRRYTPVQRLMTESRILCFYLYQLVYPVASLFSIEHDFNLSTGLISPWTTLSSILFVIGLILTGVAALKKQPLLGFALLFFFLNHMVESTILDLELVFEHRNYIPSMFFFLPLSFFCVSYFKDLKIQKNNRFMLVLSSILLTCFIFILGMGTYLRNIEWKTEKSLWLSALEKAPGRSRPYQNYSAFHVQFQKDWDFVIELNKESLEKNNSKPAYSKMVAYVNLGLGYEKKGEIEKAIKYRQKAIEVFPLKENIAGYLQLLVKADKIETAAKAILQNIKHKNLNQMGLNLRTLIYLKDHQLKPALKSGLEAILKDPFDLDAITYFGYANMVNNEYARAEHYLNKAISLNSPNQLYIGIALIQNYFGQKDMAKAEEQTLKVLEHFSLEDIFSMLDSIQKDAYPILPLSEEEIRAAFAREIKVQTKELENGRAWKTQEPNI